MTVGCSCEEPVPGPHRLLGSEAEEFTKQFPNAESGTLELSCKSSCLVTVSFPWPYYGHGFSEFRHHMRTCGMPLAPSLKTCINWESGDQNVSLMYRNKTAVPDPSCKERTNTRFAQALRHPSRRDTAQQIRVYMYWKGHLGP